MTKLIFLLILLVLINGCSHLSLNKIIKNPEKVVKDCDKFESAEEKNGCFMKFAKDISLVSSDTSVIVCDNLDSVLDKNRCLFGVFSTLEESGKLEDGIGVCKHIEKEGFLEFCESRRNGGSITVAPSLA